MSLKDEIKIEEAKVTHIETLKNFWLNLAKEMFEIEGHIVPSVENTDVWASHLVESIKEGLLEALIARKGKETVGFIEWSYPTILLQTSFKFAVIDNIYVKSDYRRKGIGTRFMEEALKRIRKKSIQNIKLSVLSENIKAIRFYEKIGLKVYRYVMRGVM